MTKADQEAGQIKQGSIAEFMRKRTQLVGFDFGLNKHTQYAVEFIDNSLDAIESFHWKETKRGSEYKFLLKDDMLLENFTYMGGGVTEEDITRIEEESQAKLVDDDGYELTEDGTIMADIEPEAVEESLIIEGEEGSEEEGNKQITEGETAALEEDEEAKELRKLQKKEKELEEEVSNILDGVSGFIMPIQAIVEREPFVLIQLTEKEAPAIYADMTQNVKEVFEYTFEIFDNGTGMGPDDLEKYGKYLASSKSQKLKQTRGSQGFGASSAFSDAQNTTGQPITAISKNINHLYGVVSEFYTTSKNNKEYVVPPTEVDTPFSHGTYLKLKYLNARYRKGTIDTYIYQTAMTNPHITIIYLDPAGNEYIYPRRVGWFPKEPTYALPHPSSVNIGDFQDLLRQSENLTVSAFLQDNFVRLSGSVAKAIISQAEEELEISLQFFHLDQGFVSWCQNTMEPIYFCRFEKRIYGKSKKPRDILTVYQINEATDQEQYWEILTQYNKKFRDITKINSEIRNVQKSIAKEEDKKKIKELEKEISNHEKSIKVESKDLSELKKNLNKVVKAFTSINENNEIKEVKITDKMEETVTSLLLSEARPNRLNQKQTESLYIAFRNQKYMSPPTDTAIPIGSSVLETTLIKEFKLALSHRTDLFLDYYPDISQLEEKEQASLPERILSKFRNPTLMETQFSGEDVVKEEGPDISVYNEFFEAFDTLHTQDDDFVSGHTRPPTSGKGLAFTVEAAIAISSKISVPKQANQVIMRYVNRTPKMRDNSDCAIWKAVQSVNWKNYKLDSFDNNIPKGNLIIIINVSGPFVHLMFKSQSKNALAEDETLMKEIKFCLEAIGRKIRNFENKRVNRENRRKRSNIIQKFIPIFVGSLLSVATKLEDLKNLKAKEIEERLLDRLSGKIAPTPEEEEESSDEESEQPPSEDEDEEVESDEDEDGVSKKPKIKPVVEEKPSEDTKPESEIETESESEVQEKPEKAVKKSSPLSEKSLESKKKTPPAPTIVAEKNADPVSIPSEKTSKASPKGVKSIDELLQAKKQVGTVPTSTPVPSKELSPKATTTKGTKPVLTSKKEISKSSTQKQLSPDSKKAAEPEKPLAKPEPSSPPKLVKPGSTSQTLEKLAKPASIINEITAERIADVMQPNEWVSLKDLINRLNIKDMNDARYLQLKIKTMMRSNQLNVKIDKGKQYWQLNK